jgi:hypothetical protein
MVHASEAVSDANALFGLRPFQDELGCQHGGYRMKVVRSHKVPEFADDFHSKRTGHDPRA